MGDMVEFPSNGQSASGYLATPASGSGPGIVVIQEWWGLVPHIKDVCDRLAGDGFTALAVDLYHGASAGNDEPDDAGKLMMEMELPRATKDMAGAVQWLVQSERAQGDAVGTMGFCMGGGLSLLLATVRPEVRATAAFYPVMPWPSYSADWSKLSGPVLGHFGAKDDYNSHDKVDELEKQMAAGGQHVEFHWYEGADHAFFNDSRPEVYDAAASQLAWDRSLALFRQQLSE